MRNPNLIGQAVNCPKCNATVQVTAPQQIRVEPLGASAADSLTETKIGIPLLEQDFSEFAPMEAPFRYDDPLLGDPTPSYAAPQSEAGQPAAPSVTPTAKKIVANPKQADAGEAVNAQAAKRRQILLVSGIASVGLLAACIGFYAFLRWQGGQADTKKQLAQNTINGTDPQKNGAKDGTAAIDQGNDPNKQATEPTDLKSTDTDSTKIPINDITQNLDPTPTVIPVEPVTPGDTNVPADSNNTEKPANNTVDPTTKVDMPKSEPPDSTSTDTEPKSSEPPVNKLAEELPPALQSFAELFSRSFEPVLPDTSLPLSPPPPSADNGASDKDNMTPASLPAVLDKQFATNISGIAIQDRPLCDVAAVLSVAADVPVCVDFDSLRAGRYDRSKTASLRAVKEQTIESLFGSWAESAGIELVPVGNMLLLAQARGADIEQHVPVEIDVADLIQGAEQEAWLLSTMKTLLPELQGDIELKGGKLTSDSAATNRLLWFQVLRLVESWRAQRSGSAPTDPSAAMIVMREWPADAVRAKLQLQLKEVSTHERPIALSMVRACREAKLECWIDWPNTVAVDFTPQRSLLTMTDKRSLQQLLELFASTLSVVIATEDDHTLWVTTAFAHRRQPRLFVVPRGTRTVEEWQKELAPLAPFAADGTKELQVIASPDNQQVFLRCCRPLLIPR
ncbi:MAG: hypothetical protein U0892_21350 [Pirellulales bacterium]